MYSLINGLPVRYCSKRMNLPLSRLIPTLRPIWLQPHTATSRKKRNENQLAGILVDFPRRSHHRTHLDSLVRLKGASCHGPSSTTLHKDACPLCTGTSIGVIGEEQVVDCLSRISSFCPECVLIGNILQTA